MENINKIRTTLIIEDENVAAQSIIRTLHEIIPGIKILNVLQTVEDSVEWFTHNDLPDIVFMDIHLADGSAFRIFEKTEIKCPIIFTTAYDQYALKAFEVNSIDYLLKPIQKSDLERSISKLLLLKENDIHQNENNQEAFLRLFAELQSQNSGKSHFLIPHKDQLIPVSTKDIACIYLENKITKVLLFNSRIYYWEKPLEVIYSQLNEQQFFRANRQYIVNRKAIDSISYWFGNKLSLVLSVPTPEKIVIGKDRVKEFKDWFTR